MNYQEALNVLGLSGVITEEAIKVSFRKMTFKYHPDRNPAAGAEMMKMINQAYDFLVANFSKFQNFVHSDNAYDYSELVDEVLKKLMEIDGLLIEIVGNWIWISGETKPNKDALSSLGCIYAGKKKMWYYRPEEHKGMRGGKKTIEEIREKYGTSGAMKSSGRKTLETRA